MRQGRVPVFRVFGQVGDAVAVAAGGFRDNRHAGRYEVAPGDQGDVHGLDRRRRLQGERDGRQGVIVRDDEFGARSAVVVVGNHAGRPAADGLKEAAQRIAGGVPRNQHLVVADTQLVVRRVVFGEIQHPGERGGNAYLGNDAAPSADVIPHGKDRLPFGIQRKAVVQPIPGIGKDDFPRTGRAAVGLFDAGNEAGKNGVPVLGDGDGIELFEGQDLPQRADGINRGDGGGGKALLVVGQARRLERQQVSDGDVVIPAACKMVMLWLDVTVSCRVRQCVYLS